MKIFFRRILLVGVAGIVLSAPASAASQVRRQNSEKPAAEKPNEPAQKPKSYTKLDFMKDLQTTMESEGYDAALALFDSRLPSKFADDFDLLFLKASVLVSAKHLDEAQKLCESLQNRDPKNQDVMALAVAIAKMRGDKKEKNKQLNALLAQDKLNSAANVELGQECFNKKNYKQALQYYKRALIREPNNIDALWGVGQTDYYLERDDEAAEFFNRILDIDPDNAQAMSYLGKLAYANSEYKIASDYAARALAIDENDYNFNLDYGMYERYLGRYEVAEKAWSKAIKIEPNYFLAYAYRGGLYDEIEEFDKAMSDYVMVAKLNPQYFYAYESIGILSLRGRQWKKARNAFMKCYEFNKDNISYPLMITYCYYMEGNPVEAKNFSNQILRKMTDKNSIEYKVLRVFHEKSGDRPIPQQIAALTNRNKRGKMYFYLGLFYDMLGGSESANECYSKVVAMDSPMFFEHRLAEWRMDGQLSFSIK